MDAIFTTGLPSSVIKKDQTVKIKSLFFDRKPVQRMINKKQLRVFGKFGAFVRNAARWSIRKAPKAGDTWKSIGGQQVLWRETSKPGEPPYSRTGLLKDNIFYAYDPASRSVVIGPVRLSRSKINVPEVLEYGGRSIAYDYAEKKHKSVYVEARPYMRPAFEKGKDKLDVLWKTVK